MSALTTAPTTTSPVAPAPPQPAIPPPPGATGPRAAAPEEYHTFAGCLTLSLVTLACLGALALFVAIFGDVSV